MKSRELEIWAGEIDSSKNWTKFATKCIFPHEKYDPDIINNYDIAIIKVSNIIYPF